MCVIIDVLNRIEKTPDGARVILKYMFPRQFNLDNVFTSEADRYKIKDYTVRTFEMDAIKRQYGHPGRGPVPKRLRGKPLELVLKMQKLHERCAYNALIKHYCPVAVSPLLLSGLSRAHAISSAILECARSGRYCAMFRGASWGMHSSPKRGYHHPSTSSPPRRLALTRKSQKIRRVSWTMRAHPATFQRSLEPCSRVSFHWDSSMEPTESSSIALSTGLSGFGDMRSYPFTTPCKESRCTPSHSVTTQLSNSLR